MCKWTGCATHVQEKGQFFVSSPRSSSDFGVLLHLPPSPITLERTKNHRTAQVVGTLVSAPGVKGPSNDDLGANTINFESNLTRCMLLLAPCKTCATMAS
jgi:hypothetical protein